MREYFRTQGRSNAPKVMVIVTDGRSTRPRETIAEAELAKREGIVVIAVGVGTEIFRDELRQIATNERKLFEVSDFAALQRIIIAIRDLICQGKFINCTNVQFKKLIHNIFDKIACFLRFYSRALGPFFFKIVRTAQKIQFSQSKEKKIVLEKNVA